MINLDYKTVLAMGAVAAVGIWYTKRQAVEVAKAINPLDQNNAVNRATHAVYDVFTDGQGTIGTDIYDAIHHEDGSFKWPWQQSRPIDANNANPEKVG